MGDKVVKAPPCNRNKLSGYIRLPAEKEAFNQLPEMDDLQHMHLEINSATCKGILPTKDL